MKKKDKESKMDLNEENEAVSGENSQDIDKGDQSQEENKEEAEEIKMTPEGKLGAELAEAKDKYLRLYSEFDNYRRRTSKEKLDLMSTAGERIVVALLPVIDDFERALDLLKDVSDEDAGKQGTTLIYNKFEDFLKLNNVKEIEALHQDFDVDLHEALTKIPAPEEKLKGKVVDVIQKGYCLNEKVIRFAKVVIGE